MYSFGVLLKLRLNRRESILNQLYKVTAVVSTIQNVAFMKKGQL